MVTLLKLFMEGWQPRPMGKHLADQLLIPLAMAGGGSFRTLPLTRHTTTNMEMVKRFLNVEIRVDDREGTPRIVITSD